MHDASWGGFTDRGGPVAERRMGGSQPAPAEPTERSAVATPQWPPGHDVGVIAPTTALGHAPVNRPMLRLSCVVPAHNEGPALADFLSALHETAATLTQHLEIVLIDDGSRDGSIEALAPLAGALGLRVLRLSRNFGKEAALMAGLRAARGDAVLLIDADFQHPLTLVPAMIDHWRAGHDMIYGVQRRRASRNPLRRIGSRVYHRLLNAIGEVPIPPDAGDFRLMSRCCVQALLGLPERNRYMKGIYAWIGFSAVALPFDAAPRRHGTSRFSMGSLASLGLAGVVAFSNLPLRAVSLVGALVSCAALGFAAYLLFEYLFLGQSISGFTTLATSILIGTGVQLIGMGVLGEYLARVYTEVKQRPDYIVAHDLDLSPLRADVGSLQYHGP